MTALRLQQNFRGSHARLLLHGNSDLAVLTATLERLGVQVLDGEVPADGAGGHFFDSLQEQCDLLFLDADLETGIDMPLSQPGRLPPVPVIGLVGVEAPSRLKALMQAGATSFLRKPVHAGSIYSALFMGVNEYLRRREMETLLADHEARRRGRRYVVKAIVMVMEQSGVDDEEAYALLRRACMKARVSLESYCESLVRSAPAKAGEASGPAVRLGRAE